MLENGQQKWLNTLLTGDEVEEFLAVQAYHGIRTNADVVRFLIRQEARRINAQVPCDSPSQ
jgi:ribosomal protein S3AE